LPIASRWPEFCRSSVHQLSRGEYYASAHTGRAVTPKERGEGGPVTRFSGSKFLSALQPRSVAKYAFQLAIIGIGYFALANATAAWASFYSSTIPVWPSSGLALAGVLVCGLRVWPAIFVAAFAAALPAGFADAEAADSVLLPLGAATGSTLEALVG